MTAQKCPRLWEAEAIEDGRLVDVDRASYERHLPGCDDCRREVQQLAEVRAVMSSAPQALRTDLQRRAERVAIVKRAHDSTLRPQRRVATRTWTMLAASLAALLFLGLWSRGRWHSERPVATIAAAPSATPGFDVVDTRAASWTTTFEGNIERVTLRAGAATFHVEHVAPDRRFIVALPDGEIEVRGTRFVVEIEANVTRSVVVTEGVVDLRVAGVSERLLHAGERWTSTVVPATTSASVADLEPTPRAPQPAPPSLGQPSPQPLVPSTAPPSPVSPVVPPAPATTPSIAAPTATPTPSTASSTTPAAPGPAASAPTTASDRYAEAIAAYRTGAYARADGLLAAFGRDFPGDARCEDAAFLRAVAHQRMGDARGAAVLAKAYLAHYPGGLRRPEAERIVAAGPE